MLKDKVLQIIYNKQIEILSSYYQVIYLSIPYTIHKVIKLEHQLTFTQQSTEW